MGTMTKLGLNASFGPRIRLVSMTVVRTGWAVSSGLDTGSDVISGSSVLMGRGPAASAPRPARVLALPRRIGLPVLILLLVVGRSHVVLPPSSLS